MKDFKIYLSIAGILLLIYLVAQYNKPNPINWSPTFYYKDKIPLGTYVLYNQLNTFFPQANVIRTDKSIYNTFHDSTALQGNYLIITRTVRINKFDFNELVKFLKNGNSAFISCFNVEGFLADTLSLDIAPETAKENARLNFTSDHVKQAEDYTFYKDLSNQYFSSFDTAKATVIGKNNFGHATYISFKFGKGTLYLSCNPTVFTNISILRSKSTDYAAKALSYLPETQNVYWDEFQNGDIPEDKSPMRVFFEHPDLQWAYYLSLAGMIIFVLFEIKRRQRIIPVIEPLTNSTVDFVNVVGQVYYEKRNNANIARKKVLYLLEHLREEYQLKTNKLDGEFIDKLTAKLNLEPEFAVALVNHILYINESIHVSDAALIELNKLIEQFYTKSR